MTGGGRSQTNVLVIVADQLRADHLGFGGSSVADTPHLDHLAASGTTFDSATVANPTCMPNRATLVTGRWPMVHGTRTNGVPLDSGTNTLMRVLRRSGWHTSAVGKLHFQPMGWPYEPEQAEDIEMSQPGLLRSDVQEAWLRELGRGWDAFEDADRHRAGWLEMPADYYGFDSVDLVVGHGDRASGHYLHWARQRGLDPVQVGGFEHAQVRYEGWDEVYQSEIPAALHPTAYVTERAIERLTTHAEARQPDPLLLYVSFPDPHHPFCPPPEYYQRYRPDAQQLPATFRQDHGSSPEHVQRIAQARGRPHHDPTMTWAPTEEQFRYSLAAELGLISMIDDGIGQLLHTLDKTGLADDTIVVFTSDHGDMFGDHGLLLKHFVHYRGVTRVPLVIRAPGSSRPGAHVPALVSTADVMPTLLDLLGLQGYLGIQGRSLRPLIEGITTDGRSRVLVEEDQPFGVPGLPAPVRIRTLITPSGRLTLYAGSGVSELYDLVVDPDETTNLAGCAEGAGLHAELTADLAEELTLLAETGRRPVASG